MAIIDWPSLLKTIDKIGASDALITAGAPPLVRTGRYWRALDVAELPAADEVAKFAREKLGASPKMEADGRATAEIVSGDGIRFRVIAFGHPSPAVLLIVRLSEDAEQAGVLSV